jgi:hypothetical protein
MKNPATQPVFSVRLLGTIKLPYFDREPGPLHTILQDECNHIYYSDEINHSLVSLTADGDVRWHRGEHGTKAAEFNYPKGIELGWINEKGNKTRCIAVCDSWNHRIQFLDLDGNFLTAWDFAGDISFNDVVDIRFVDIDGDSKRGSPCWLVLDRGHHSLFGLNLSGHLIFKIGRALPENLECCWPMPGERPNPQSFPLDSFGDCLPYDPLFMPLRIFGNSREALFVLEPKSRRLKQAALSNFLPVWIKLPSGAEWIGADEHGLLCFDKSAGRLGSYDSKSHSWQSALLNGVAISSGRSSREIWSQNDSAVCHWDCTLGEEECNQHDKEPPWFLSALPDEIESAIHAGMASADLGLVQEAIAHLRVLSSKALEVHQDRWSDAGKMAETKSSLTSLLHALEEALLQMKGFSYSLFLGILKLQIFQSIYPATNGGQYFRDALDRIETATKPIANLFEESVLFRDDWLFARLASPLPGNTDQIRIREICLQEHYDALLRVTQEIAKRLWHVPFCGTICKASERSAPSDSLEGSSVFVKRSSPSSQASSKHLREIDRIFLGDDAQPGCISPTAICYAHEIGFLVSLKNTGQIMRLNEQGHLLGPIPLPGDPPNILRQPHGLAIDSANRIWISRPQSNCIEIIDTSVGQLQSLQELAGRSLGLKYPTGIFGASNRKMLIADTQNSRILVATPSGQIESLVRLEGKKTGELRHPIAFCHAKEKSEFWVVEIRNHRLQRFSLHGQSLAEIGGLGLGKGHLVLPESATTFDDGVVAISQRQCTRVIKLFSKDGDELETLQLDYSPLGILAHNAFMLVCEGNGDHIRVYERI